jgi:preprotein translocase subunit SecE
MAKQVAQQAQKLGPIARITEFVNEVKTEMSKVSWPTKEELKSLTSVVMVCLLILGIVIGVYDWAFLRLIKVFLLLG